MADYTIQRLEDLNTIDKNSFSKLEKLTFNLAPNEQFNRSCESALGRIKSNAKLRRYTVQDNYSTLGSAIGFALPIISTAIIGIPQLGMTLAPFVAYFGYEIGILCSDKQCGNNSYNEFSELREKIKAACNKLSGGPYRSYPVLEENNGGINNV